MGTSCPCVGGDGEGEGVDYEALLEASGTRAGARLTTPARGGAGGCAVAFTVGFGAALSTGSKGTDFGSGPACGGGEAAGVEGELLLVHGADDDALVVVEHRQVDRAEDVVLGELGGRARVDDLVKAG